MARTYSRKEVEEAATPWEKYHRYCNMPWDEVNQPEAPMKVKIKYYNGQGFFRRTLFLLKSWLSTKSKKK